MYTTSHCHKLRNTIQNVWVLSACSFSPYSGDWWECSFEMISDDTMSVTPQWQGDIPRIMTHKQLGLRCGFDLLWYFYFCSFLFMSLLWLTDVEKMIVVFSICDQNVDTVSRSKQKCSLPEGLKFRFMKKSHWNFIESYMLLTHKGALIFQLTHL